MTALIENSTTLRCRGCAVEVEVHGTSTFNDVPEGWQIEQWTYYNPNGQHYCLRCSRKYWVAFCLGDDGEGNCGSCFGEMEVNGLLVSAPVGWTEDEVLSAIQAKHIECEGGNKILGVEACEIQEPSAKHDVEL